MSLRTRLTFLYTSLVAGILLLFGVAVYISVIGTLIEQIDVTLQSTANEIIPKSQVRSVNGELIIDLPPLETLSGIAVQAWGRSGRIHETNVNLTRPLDQDSLDSNTSIYRDVVFGDVHLRVLTVPIWTTAGRRLGILQIATPMSTVDETQRILLTVLIGGTMLAIFLAGIIGWFNINRALAPLGDVTQTALQITNADDLSRRIPYQGPPNDEVGQLIRAFNQTLSRLEKLFNTQRRFMADVGHELRTPLTVIKGEVGLIRRIGEADEESLSDIENEVERLTRLVGDLLLLAQAESGKLPLANELVELDTVLLEVMQQMRVLAYERVQLRLADIDQVLVCGDRDRLKQVFVNLISNAIGYTPVGGEVVVGIGKENDQAMIMVTDTGPGIPPDDLPHIFERFYRGEKSRTRPKEGKGFGLGLSIVYWIVRHHEGRIEVKSTVGEGTTFCVWLPLSKGECQEI